MSAINERKTLPWFAIQWHITALCDQRCKHCYIVNNSRQHQRELSEELTTQDCMRVIDALLDLCKQASAQPLVGFTGGDPLLRKDFFQLAQYATERQIAIRMMGNPFHLTDEVISQMQENKIINYQVSLDGMEETHDWFRKPGSFRSTIKAIELLTSNNMRTAVMFTLSRRNVDDLLDVMTLVGKLGVNSFSFARYAAGCTASPHNDNAELEFTPKEYRELLISVQRHANALRDAGVRTRFGQKDHLWKLLLFEQGQLKLEDNPQDQIISGCHIGRSNLTILADGTVFACRRFYSPVGKVPKQSLLEIFVSDELDYYRNFDKFQKCRDCELLRYCRGCPAIAFAHSGGNFYAPDPQCWRS